VRSFLRRCTNWALISRRFLGFSLEQVGFSERPAWPKRVFFSCSVKSPAKSSMPSGSNQMRPSLTSMWEKTAVLGKLDCCVCEDSSASGAAQRDVYQPRDTVVGSSASDDTSAVGMADQDNRAADPADSCFRYGDVFSRRVEAVLRRNALVPFGLQGND